MERSLPPRKTPINLSQSLEHQLNSYALAAGAAGVGMLALAQPAQAKIVYTKAHEVIGLYGLHSYQLDLNHDGVADFVLDFHGSGQRQALGVGREGTGNGIVGPGSASALKAGVRIGPEDRFYGGDSMASMSAPSNPYSFYVGRGFWPNVTNRYLGLKLVIQGKIHYGWARLTVKAQRRSGIVALLTGYAYETIPNKPIIAGQTHGADDAEPPAPASLAIPAGKPTTLGLLALGAPGLSIWKKEPLAETAQPVRGSR